MHDQFREFGWHGTSSAVMEIAGETRLQYKRDFADFLEATPKYGAQIKELAEGAEEGKPFRLSLDMDDLLRGNPELHRQMLATPSECLPPCEEALDEAVR